MCIAIQALDQLFGFSGSKKISINGTCRNCGRSLRLSITKTSSGYGFLGGMLHQYDFFQNFVIECAQCFGKSDLLFKDAS